MNRGENIKSYKLAISAMSLTKYLAIAYIIVSKALVPLGVVNGGTKLVLLLLLTSCTLWTESLKPYLNNLFRVEAVMIFVTTVTGMLIARNKGYVLDTMQSLVYEMLFGYCMYRISVRERKIDWFAYAWIITSIILVGYIYITGGYSDGKLARISINESTNVNTIGVFIMFGIWCVLYLLSNKKMSIIRTVAGVLTIAIFLYFIIQTVSRKSLIGSAFLIIFWLVFVLNPYLKRMSFGKRWVVITLIAGATGFIYWKFGAVFSDASIAMNYRMSKLTEENITDMHRAALIKDALRVFVKHPLFGVGWNNYRFYSAFGQYSHNTYVEVLACTGLVGSFLAYALWFIEFKQVLLIIKKRKNKVVLANIICLLIILLFIDAVQIMYYNSTLLMIMHMIFTLSVIGSLNNNELSA